MRKLLIVLVLVAPGAASASCGSAFCTVNTNWDVQGAWTEPGTRLDLRYEYVRQDQLMAGKNRVQTGQFARDHDELVTNNQNFLAALDYTINQDWAVNLLLPVVKREHRHIETATTQLESWNFTELGDVRVMARRRLATLEDARPSVGTLGLHVGLKLPTGRTDVLNGSGERAEHSLQPGTGTTELLAGLFYSRLLPMSNQSWVVQPQLLMAVLAGSDFRPGNRYSLDAGTRYGMGDALGLLLQVNALVKGRDGGGMGEREDSGGSYLFVSPGFSYALSRSVQAYGFLQLPVYQYVNGVQLTASYAVSLGIGSRF